MSAAYTPAFSRNDQSLVARWFWTVNRGLLGAARQMRGADGLPALQKAAELAPADPEAWSAGAARLLETHREWLRLEWRGAALEPRAARS